MDEPTRWSDPRGGAPPEVQRLLAAARGGAPTLPEPVRSVSAAAAAGLGAGARAAGWWTAAKVVGALAAVSAAGVSVAHRSPRPAHHAAAPSPVPARRPASAPERPLPMPTPSHDAIPVAEPERPPVAPARPAVADERPRDTLADAAMLERARQLLASGDTALAVAVLRDHARRHPRSALAEERDYLTFRANTQGATGAGVEREAERFLRRHPDGIYSARVRSLVGARE